MEAAILPCQCDCRREKERAYMKSKVCVLHMNFPGEEIDVGAGGD
jgi:hypothetical protein